MPLVVAPIGKELKIIKILVDANTKKHLANLGFVVDEKLTIMSVVNGSVICLIKDGRVALDKEIAMKIFVQ